MKLRLSCLVFFWSMAALPAVSATRILLVPGDRYVVELQREQKRLVLARPRVDKRGWQRLDRYLQVAAGGTLLAVWDRGLLVYSADGRLLFRRADALPAFQFSPDGSRLGIARNGGIEIVTASGEPERFIGGLPGVEEIRWTDAGPVARSRGRLVLARPERNQVLAAIKANEPYAAAGDRIVYVGKQGLLSFAPSTGAVSPLAVTGNVVDLELSADGERLLVATPSEILLQGKVVARASELRSLAFSADGKSYLWLGREGGAAGSLSLPEGTLTAVFGKDCVLTATLEEATCRDPVSGRVIRRGGISSNDGTNYAAEVVGENGMAVLFYLKPGSVKRQQIFTGDPLR